MTFEPLDAGRTRVNVEIVWEPDTLAEKAGSAVGADSLRVGADLDKFKKFIEAQGHETGGWRGTISGGDVDEAGGPLV